MRREVSEKRERKREREKERYIYIERQKRTLNRCRTTTCCGGSVLTVQLDKGESKQFQPQPPHVMFPLL